MNFSPKCWGSQKKLGSGMVPSSLHSYTEAKATFIIKKKAERQVSNEENSSLNLLKLLFEIRQFQQHVWAFYERLKKHVFSQTFSCSILIESFSENRVFFCFLWKSNRRRKLPKFWSFWQSRFDCFLSCFFVYFCYFGEVSVVNGK